MLRWKTERSGVAQCLRGRKASTHGVGRGAGKRVAVSTAAGGGGGTPGTGWRACGSAASRSPCRRSMSRDRRVCGMRLGSAIAAQAQASMLERVDCDVPLLPRRTPCPPRNAGTPHSGSARLLRAPGSGCRNSGGRQYHACGMQAHDMAAAQVNATQRGGDRANRFPQRDASAYRDRVGHGPVSR